MNKMMIVFAASLLASVASAATATREYVDAKDAATLQAAKDYTDQHGGGGSSMATNAVIDIIHATVDGAARPLPKYLHALDFDDSYPEAAAEYYRSRGDGKVDGGCSSVRSGGYLYRNFDYPFDDRAEFVVKMSAGKDRFASVGVAQVGTNFTEQMVTSGKPEFSARYKWLPGATVDGINEHGVACNINVVSGDPQTSGWHNDTGDLHPLAAIRWILDNATNAQSAAEYIASHVAFSQGWEQNFHFMIADTSATYIVEDGVARDSRTIFTRVEPPTLTNFKIFNWAYGEGQERFNILIGGANITNAWYTNAYRRETNPPWVSDLAEVIAYTNEIFDAWASHPKEYFRGKTNGGIPWWQTVHTSIYDITNRVLRVAVQETDDWYTFQVPASGAKVDAYTRAETDAKLAGKLGATLDENGWHIEDSINIAGDVDASGDVKDAWGNILYDKADRADSGDADEIATLDTDGNPTRSGIAKTNVATKNDLEDYLPLSGGELSGGIYAHQSIASDTIIVAPTVDVSSDIRLGSPTYYLHNEDECLADDNGKFAHVSMISATNTAFSNEVATVAKTVQPTTVRAYDSVRRCWWVLEIVNGVPTWTVED